MQCCSLGAQLPGSAARGPLEQDGGEGVGDDDDAAELGQREPEVAAEGLVQQEGPEDVDGLGDGLVGSDDAEPADYGTTITLTLTASRLGGPSSRHSRTRNTTW